jgi:hypothetical protein
MLNLQKKILKAALIAVVTIGSFGLACNAYAYNSYLDTADDDLLNANYYNALYQYYDGLSWKYNDSTYDYYAYINNYYSYLDAYDGYLNTYYGYTAAPTTNSYYSYIYGYYAYLYAYYSYIYTESAYYGNTNDYDSAKSNAYLADYYNAYALVFTGLGTNE